MAYAANNKISKQNFTGAIEITDAQYKAAQDALLSGREVVVVEGEMIIADETMRSVYRTADGVAKEIADNFPTPAGYTDSPRPSPCHEWNGTDWVADPALKWADVRAQRDGLLSQSDWTQVADAPVDQQAWATYRQALRDLPADQADPFDITWPQPPVDQ